MHSVLLSIMLMTAADQTGAADDNWVIVTDEMNLSQKRANPIGAAIMHAENSLYALRKEICGYPEREEDYQRISGRYRQIADQAIQQSVPLFLNHPHSKVPSCNDDDITYRMRLNAVHHQLSDILQLLNKKAR